MLQDIVDSLFQSDNILSINIQNNIFTAVYVHTSMNAQKFQRFLNGVTLKPYYDFDCGQHIAKIMFNKKTDLKPREALELCFFISIFFESVKPTKQRLYDIYYWKQPKIVNLIYDIITKCKFRQNMTLNLQKQRRYEDRHQQQYCLKFMYLLIEFVGRENFQLFPETENQYLDVYLNYFKDTPDLNMPFPDEIYYYKIFKFYQTQQNNTYTNVFVINQLTYLNQKIVLDLCTIRDLHLYGGKYQMVNIKIFLTPEVIKIIKQNFDLTPENDKKLQRILEKDIKKDIIYQQQGQPVQWCYISDVFIQLIKMEAFTNELMNDCLNLTKESKISSISFDIQLKSLHDTKQAIKMDSVVNIITVKEKLQKDSVDFLICHCDPQIVKQMAKILTIYSYKSEIKEILEPTEYYKLFTVNNFIIDVLTVQNVIPTSNIQISKPPSINKVIEKQTKFYTMKQSDVEANQKELQEIYYKHLCNLIHSPSFDLANLFFDDVFGLTKNFNDDSGDIEQLTSKLSFQDPITLNLISSPVRSTRCNHLQALNEETLVRQQVCPLCQQPVTQIMEDYLFQSIIDAFRLNDAQVISTEININTFTLQNVQVKPIYKDDDLNISETESVSDWFDEDKIENPLYQDKSNIGQQMQQGGFVNINQSRTISLPDSMFQTVSNLQQINKSQQDLSKSQVSRSSLYSLKNTFQAPYIKQVMKMERNTNLSLSDDESSEQTKIKTESDAFVKSFQSGNSLESKRLLSKQHILKKSSLVHSQNSESLREILHSRMINNEMGNSQINNLVYSKLIENSIGNETDLQVNDL